MLVLVFVAAGAAAELSTGAWLGETTALLVVSGCAVVALLLALAAGAALAGALAALLSLVVLLSSGAAGAALSPLDSPSGIDWPLSPLLL